MACKLKIELKHHTREQVLKELLRVCQKLGIDLDKVKNYGDPGREDYEMCGDAGDWNIETFFAIVPVKSSTECELYDFKEETYSFPEYTQHILDKFDKDELDENIKIKDSGIHFSHFN